MTAASSSTTVQAETSALYVVATPIGNLEDMSLRARHVLESVDGILAEDTRHSQHLLSTLGIKKPLISLHAHNENTKSSSIISALLQGQSFALISDAGTPLISDPGYPLIKLAHEQHIQVIPIPGACAITTALCAAGVPCDVFTFGGFLPAKSTARQQKLQLFSTMNHTLVFYESTHRILESLDDVIKIFGLECKLVLAKELTKTFERFIQGDGEEIKHWLLSDPGHSKGEFVLIIPPRTLHQQDEEPQKILIELLQELPLKKAVKIACQLTKMNKNTLYKMALDLQKD